MLPLRIRRSKLNGCYRQKWTRCYILTYADSHLHTCTYICRIIHNDTMIKTDAGRLLEQNMYLSLYCKGSKRVTQGLRVRGSWWPNRNCNILTPTHMAINVVSFSFSRCSTGGPGAHSAWWWLSLLHFISIISGPQLIRAPMAPSAWCGFPYHISSITPSDL